MSTPKTLYVSDLDGTLLNRSSRLDSATLALLNEALSLGALFTVATARTPATVMPLLEGLEASLPFIVMSGGALWHPKKEEYESTNVIDPLTVRHIAQVFEAHGLHPFIYRRVGARLEVTHGGGLSPQEAEFVAQRRELPHKTFRLDCDDYATSRGDALLIFSMHAYELLRPVKERLDAEACCSSVLYHDIFDHGTGLLEIYRLGTSKAQAIKHLASREGAQRIVVFGDNLNDLEMMRCATCGIAVSNAVPEVKAVATEVIGDNDSHSVAKWIAQDLARSQGNTTASLTI